jgi:hypothetical protein
MMLAYVIDAYLLKQRSLGMRFESAEQLLRRFCRVMGNPEIDEITPEAVAAFLHGTGALSATWMLKYRCYGAGDERCGTIVAVKRTDGAPHEARRFEPIPRRLRSE